MKPLSLFAEVRSLYVRQLVAAIAGVDSHVEPALRTRDGKLAVEGSLALPMRVDYIPRKGDGKSVMVNSTSRVAFEPIPAKYKQCDVRLNPFIWDSARISVSGLKESEVGELARDWFFRWFDAEDQNAANTEGLYGVVHFLGEPRAGADGIELTIDLGSAPAEALNDLLDRLASRGASAIRLK